MESIITKINTLRKWQATNQVKTHKGLKPDELTALLNELELDVVLTIKELKKDIESDDLQIDTSTKK